MELVEECNGCQVDKINLSKAPARSSQLKLHLDLGDHVLTLSGIFIPVK